jgi:hypothetical protein
MRNAPLVLLAILILVLALSVARADARSSPQIDRTQYILQLLNSTNDEAFAYLDGNGNSIITKEEFTEHWHRK